MNRYTSLEVNKLRSSGQEPGWQRAAEGMADAMRWYYDDTGGKKDGLPGFLLALGSGIYEAAKEMKFMESQGSGELPSSAAEFFERAAAAARRAHPGKAADVPAWAEQLCSWLCGEGGPGISKAVAKGDGWAIAELQDALDCRAGSFDNGGRFFLLRDGSGGEREDVRSSVAEALGSAPHCLEIAGTCERWWFGWHDGKNADGMRICSLAHENALHVMGGGEVQLFQTVRALRTEGVVSDVKIGGRIPDGCSLCHVYSLHHLRDVAGTGRTSYVLSPIYWDRAELAWAAPRITALFSRSECEEEIQSGYAALRAQAIGVELQHMAFGEGTQSLVAGAAIVAPNADCERECIERSMGGPLPTCRKVPNAFCDLPEAPDDAEAEQLLPDRPFVLCVGRVEPNKNQLTLVWALSDSELDVVLIGSEPDSEYSALCRRFGGDRAHLLGRQPPSVVRRAYQRAVAHCLPGFGETPGIANLEAASLGCPIVVSDRGAEMEYFGDRAWYADPLDPESIRLAVLEAGKARGSGRTLALQSHVRAEFTWQAVAERLSELYGSVALEATGAV